ncbi:hypothetical protein QBC34DRAFT_394416 [Podospora aff. communis PSN243]|uniref:DUF2461 domain-containing protein n=1 Tax=Podospora aff. communis PSN243 TaxID=3040156 RepID=A0AAV9H0V3_9PEZI|nr:hypothetical protein QBC34DRAFT_394416 [Podospora aff. communis PSN243]
MVGRKRKAAAVAKEETPETPVMASSSRRRSGRVSSSATKSRYFEADSDSDELAQTSTKKAKKSSSSGRKAKKARVVEDSDDEDNYEDEPVDEVDEDSDEDHEEEEEEEEVKKPVKKPKANGRKAKKQAEPEDDSDSDAPPKVTFIPTPKLRDTGGVAYVDEKLHQNTLAFLKDLKANNKRDWLKSHDAEYRRSLKDWESYVTSLTEKIIAVDETIPELPFKDINFRIYRDIRFSNDPTPYKPHYAAAWSRTGRKGPYACYYVHVEPGKSFVGGGLWHPDGESVHRLRASIDERPRRWRRVLTEERFVGVFFPEVGGGGTAPKAKGKKGKEKVSKEEREAAVLKAFAKGNAENALKTKPKGFIAEHRDIELLKLRNFTVGKKIPDSIFTSEGGQEELVEVVRAMVGFVAHLNRIVRPDPGDDDEESEEGEE